MTAAPQYGTLIFKGLQTGKTYSVDIYVSDVANALVHFDGGAGAGASSPTHWIPPEDVALIDYAQVTGTSDTTKIRLIRNGKPTSQVLRYSMFLTTLNNRPPLNIGFRQGTQVSAIQLA